MASKSLVKQDRVTRLLLSDNHPTLRDTKMTLDSAHRLCGSDTWTGKSGKGGPQSGHSTAMVGDWGHLEVHPLTHGLTARVISSWAQLNLSGDAAGAAHPQRVGFRALGMAQVGSELPAEHLKIVRFSFHDITTKATQSHSPAHH